MKPLGVIAVLTPFDHVPLSRRCRTSAGPAPFPVGICLESERKANYRERPRMCRRASAPGGTSTKVPAIVRKIPFSPLSSHSGHRDGAGAEPDTMQTLGHPWASPGGGGTPVRGLKADRGCGASTPVALGVPAPEGADAAQGSSTGLAPVSTSRPVPVSRPSSPEDHRPSRSSAKAILPQRPRQEPAAQGVADDR